MKAETDAEISNLGLRSNMARKLFLCVRFLISLVIIVLLIWHFGWESIKDTLGMSELWYVPLIMLALIISLMLGAANIKLLLIPFGRIAFIRIARLYLLSWGFGLFFPSQMDGIILTYFLKKEEIPYHQGVSVLIVDKVITLAFYLTVGGLAMMLLFPQALSTRFLFLPVFLIGGVLVLRKIVHHFSSMQNIFGRIMRIIGKGGQETCQLVRYYPKLMFGNGILTIVRFGFGFLCYYLAFLAINVDVDYFHVSGVSVIGSLVSLIPINVGGLGTAEAMAVYLFGSMAISGSAVISAYLLLRIVLYLNGLTFICLLGKGMSQLRVPKSNTINIPAKRH